MTKITVKRYSLEENGNILFSSNDYGMILHYLNTEPYMGRDSNFSIRDNHAVIEKLAEKAKNN